MRIKSVEYDVEDGKYVIEFQHNNGSWFKSLTWYASVFENEKRIKDLLNSVIEDTIARTR